MTLPVNGVIPGWQEALQMMKVGAKWKIFVPPKLAYGEHGAGDAIGPNETLIFEIELLSIKNDQNATESAQQDDQAAPESSDNQQQDSAPEAPQEIPVGDQAGSPVIDSGLLTALELRLQEILQAHPEGLSEYELIGALQAGERPLFDAGIFQDSVSLFRAHFLLFHALYRLRERLLAERQAPTCTSNRCVSSWGHYHAPDRSQLDHPDPLRAYYLDLSQLENTGREEIESMLGRFWSRLYADDHRLEALRTLGLERTGGLRHHSPAISATGHASPP